MLEQHLTSPVTRQRLRSGPVAEYADGFADWLHHHGFKPVSIRSRLQSLAKWADWLSAAGFGSEDFPAAYEASRDLLQEGPTRTRTGINRDAVAVASIFIRYLGELGIIPQPDKLPSPSDCWPLLAAYRSWMSRHRGLKDESLDTYQVTLIPFLNKLGDNPKEYTAENVRSFVLERSRTHSIARAKCIVVAMRSFCRFLEATGRVSPGMVYGIPGFRQSPSSTVPRFLTPDQVDRVIESCSGEDRLRDRAVILLLARLGLRAGEVARLSIRDIDWNNARITVNGKGRRQAWLPLPQAVGDAILLYLQHGRPSVPASAVFCTVLAPARPLTRAAVTHIVKSALKRAGVEAPVNGAHLLRHSAATAMLRQGASLAGVGALLRHRNPATTAHYAKVDFALLREVAQAWPGEMEC